MAELADLVEWLRNLPYERPSDRTVEGMLRERFPSSAPQIVHRVHTAEPEGVVDVHGYVTAVVAGKRALEAASHTSLVARQRR